MLWHGRIFDGKDHTPATDGIRRLTGLLTNNPDWVTSLIPVRDGVMLAYKV
jgi:predicted O-methyltransferase YrrM